LVEGYLEQLWTETVASVTIRLKPIGKNFKTQKTAIKKVFFKEMSSNVINPKIMLIFHAQKTGLTLFNLNTI